MIIAIHPIGDHEDCLTSSSQRAIEKVVRHVVEASSPPHAASLGESAEDQLQSCGVETGSLAPSWALNHVFTKLGQSLQTANDRVVEPDTKMIDNYAVVETFIDSIYTLSAAVAPRVGVRAVFTRMNEWLVDGRLDLCDYALSRVDLSKLSVDYILSFLTITMACREQLNHRQEYLRKAQEFIAQLRGQSVASRLLSNYG